MHDYHIGTTLVLAKSTILVKPFFVALLLTTLCMDATNLTSTQTCLNQMAYVDFDFRSN